MYTIWAYVPTTEQILVWGSLKHVISTNSLSIVVVDADHHMSYTSVA